MFKRTNCASTSHQLPCSWSAPHSAHVVSWWHAKAQAEMLGDFFNSGWQFQTFFLMLNKREYEMKWNSPMTCWSPTRGPERHFLLRQDPLGSSSCFPGAYMCALVICLWEKRCFCGITWKIQWSGVHKPFPRAASPCRAFTTCPTAAVSRKEGRVLFVHREGHSVCLLSHVPRGEVAAHPFAHWQRQCGRQSPACGQRWTIRLWSQHHSSKGPSAFLPCDWTDLSLTNHVMLGLLYYLLGIFVCFSFSVVEGRKWWFLKSIFI